MKTKVPIIINKLESIEVSSSKQEVRPSAKLQTNKHVIREYYFNRKSFY